MLEALGEDPVVPVGPVRRLRLDHDPDQRRVGDAARRAAAPWSGRLITLDGPADLLIRPDGIVAWAGDGDLASALATWLGPPRG